MGNVIKVSFGANRQAKTRPLWQYDYGQKILLCGIDLPQTYEVHFSKSESAGTAVTMLGGEDGVEIPNDLLETSGSVYAFLYLHVDGYDGETVYRIEIPVKARPHTEDIIPPEQQTIIEQAVIAINNAIDEVEGYAEEAEESAEQAAGYAGSAEDSERAAKQYKEAAADSATSSLNSANAAALSENHVIELEAQTAGHAASASLDAGKAEDSATAAAASATAAASSAEEAALYKPRLVNSIVVF